MGGSVALQRRLKCHLDGNEVQGYPRPNLFDLFKAYKPLSGNSEKLSAMIEHFFNTTMTDVERQRMLNEYRSRKRVA